MLYYRDLFFLYEGKVNVGIGTNESVISGRGIRERKGRVAHGG